MWDHRLRGLLLRAFGPRNLMKKWGSLDVAGPAGQNGKPAKAGCGQNWPPHSVGAFSTRHGSLWAGAFALLRPPALHVTAGELYEHGPVRAVGVSGAMLAEGDIA